MAEAMSPGSARFAYRLGSLDALDPTDVRGGVPSPEEPRVLPRTTIVFPPDGYVAFRLEGLRFIQSARCDQPGTVVVRMRDSLRREMVPQEVFELGAYTVDCSTGTLRGPLSAEDIRKLFDIVA